MYKMPCRGAGALWQFNLGDTARLIARSDRHTGVFRHIPVYFGVFRCLVGPAHLISYGSMIIIDQIRVNETHLMNLSSRKYSSLCTANLGHFANIALMFQHCWSSAAVVIEDDAIIIQLASQTTETHPNSNSAQVYKCATFRIGELDLVCISDSFSNNT